MKQTITNIIIAALLFFGVLFPISIICVMYWPYLSTIKELRMHPSDEPLAIEILKMARNAVLVSVVATSVSIISIFLVIRRNKLLDKRQSGRV
jgi:amino acid transporter